MILFKLILPILSGLTAWWLATHLAANELTLVVAVGCLLAATAVGMALTTGATLGLLRKRLIASGLSWRLMGVLQAELWWATLLFAVGLVISVISFSASEAMVAGFVVTASVVLGLAYAFLIDAARLFYKMAAGTVK